jgi:predicted  nucleic acid-binding Zn-ribbon protein
MPEDVKLNISGNMSKLKGQFSKADNDLNKKFARLQTLKTQISATEARMSAMRARMAATAVGVGKGAAVGLATGALTIALQEGFTVFGMEGSFLANVGVASAIGAAGGGPVGAAVAALAVSVAHIVTKLGELGDRVARMDGLVESEKMRLRSIDAENKQYRKMLTKQLGEYFKTLEELTKNRVKSMSHNILRETIAREN